MVCDPECVRRHLSKKIKNYPSILEFGCGVGNLTINVIFNFLYSKKDKFEKKIIFAMF